MHADATLSLCVGLPWAATYVAPWSTRGESVQRGVKQRKLPPPCHLTWHQGRERGQRERRETVVEPKDPRKDGFSRL